MHCLPQNRVQVNCCNSLKVLINYLPGKLPLFFEELESSIAGEVLSVISVCLEGNSTNRRGWKHGQSLKY